MAGRQIILSEDEEFGWVVREGDRYADKLGSDEALFLLANILCRPQQEKVSYGGMGTAEEHAAYNARVFGTPAAPLEPWQRQLPPTQET